jgi:hypothetical protein
MRGRINQNRTPEDCKAAGCVDFHMEPARLLRYALDPTTIMVDMRKPPDEWQKQVLRETKKHILLNCHRQNGKTTVLGVKACHRFNFFPGSTTIILSKTQRQAAESFRRFLDAHYAINAPVKFTHDSILYCEGENKSRVISLPGREDTIRGYSAVDLLIIDEASRVPDDLYNAVRPMVAISNGQIAVLSTPFGQRGFFYREWIGAGDWLRISSPAAEVRNNQVTKSLCPRMNQLFLQDEFRALGPSVFAQEYLNEFTAVSGRVYPRFEECLIERWPNPEGRKLGGIDWGWRNPFAAVWGVHDHSTDILYIHAERYERNTTLHEHREALKKLNCNWIADPAGPTEIAEFRAADINIWKGNNDIKAGIAAVTARMETGRLKIYAPGCPNLTEEAKLYRYPDKREFHPEPEKPIDENNHALGALRYLVSQLDRHFIARFRNAKGVPPNPKIREQKPKPAKKQKAAISDPNLWTIVN